MMTGCTTTTTIPRSSTGVTMTRSIPIMMMTRRRRNMMTSIIMTRAEVDDRLTFRTPAHVVACLDLIFTTFELASTAFFTILIWMGFGINFDFGGGGGGEMGKNCNMAVALFVTACLVLESAIVLAQYKSIVKLMRSTEIGRNAGEALQMTAFWRILTIVLLIFYGLAILGLIAATLGMSSATLNQVVDVVAIFCYIALATICRGVFFFVVEQYVKELVGVIGYDEVDFFRGGGDEEVEEICYI